ncbi:MAG: hypothetical protein FWF43_09705, partial [Propionibacteriaceae bacterium]|nr:hypothetical protein [Propionibacteriaceae bacterium]
MGSTWAGADFHQAAGASQAIEKGQNQSADRPTSVDSVASPATGAFNIRMSQFMQPSIHVTNQQELLAAVVSAQASGEPTGIAFDNDIQMDQTIDIPSGTTITVAGPYKLEMTADLTTISVEQGASLTIDGIDVTAAAGTTGTGLVVDGNLTLASGSITNNVNDNEGFGGGVTVSAPGSFTMTGGTISGNTAGTIPATITECGGGGVRNDGVGATFTLTGGTISGNTAAYSGGGVCNANGATFVMDGGEIT